ncbi:MAG: outer membrane lipoprotein-sorting protein [Flavobacteriales bacterium]|jgi:outer membrane lipoprotein-sorting protein
MRNFKLVLTTLLCSAFSFAAIAQTGQEILDDLSKSAKTYKTIYAEYESKLIADGVDQTQKGKVYVEGEKYNLELGNYNIITDGETIWTFDNSSNECYVDNLEDLGDDAMSPAKMFTIWEDNFKNELKGTLDVNGNPHHHVNLYPNNQAEQTYHTIQLYIDKAKMEVTKFVVKGRDGTDVIYSISNFKPNMTMPTGIFNFSAAKHPGVEIIDNRI